jgi:hypothetical protein
MTRAAFPAGVRTAAAALAIVVLAAVCPASPARAATPYDQRVGVALRIGGGPRGDDSAYWQAGFGPWDGAHAHPRIVSLFFRWNQVEPKPGTWDWGRLANSYADARAHGYFIILRVVTGHFAPSWIYTTAGVTGVTLYDPDSGAYDYRFPVVWSKPYRHQIALLAQEIGSLLQTRFPGSTETWGDYTAGVPVAAASDNGTEMALRQRLFYNKRSRAVWNAVTPEPPRGESKMRLRSDLTAGAWEKGVAHYLAAITNAPVLLALGGMFKDHGAHATVMAHTLFTSANAGRLVGMHTNFIPDRGQDAGGAWVPTGPWGRRFPRDADQLKAIRRDGGAVALQSASYGGGTPHSYAGWFTNPQSAYVWALRNDLMTRWATARFFETSGVFANPAIAGVLLNEVQPALVAAHG